MFFASPKTMRLFSCLFLCTFKGDEKVFKKKYFGLIVGCSLLLSACGANGGNKEVKSSSEKSSSSSTEEVVSGASSNGDVTTSASVVPDNLVTKYEPKGFTDNKEKKKVLMVVGDPRKYSVNYDLVNTAMAFFEENNFEVELRDLYDMKFNPVLSEEDFYNAKDGTGDTPEDVKTEQDFVTQADHIVFSYPNWHDTPTAIVKGYMERVFAKQFAYKDSDKGLEGLLTDKDIYTIMNCGYLGGGQGFIGDGVGQNDETWDEYMQAFKVLDDDTAGFWGVKNRGRFMNDQTPKNNSETYEKDMEELRNVLKEKLQADFIDKKL